jgi:hypothetical protein
VVYSADFECATIYRSTTDPMTISFSQTLSLA